MVTFAGPDGGRQERAMKRRQFFLTAAAAAGLAARERTWAQTSSADRLSRVAIMMFGLNSIVKNNFAPSPDRTLDIMDMGQFAADQFGVHQISVQSNYFPSTEMSWLKDFKSRLAKTKTRLVQVNLEFGAGYNMGAEAPSGRLQMIDLHRVWLDKVAFLECPRVLLNQGQPSEENKALITSNYRAVVALAKEKGIMPCSENRGGAGGRGATPAGAAAPPPPPPPTVPTYIILTEILRASGTATCVDFLNFPDQPTQHQGIRAMLPLTSGLLHAGMRFDLPPAMAICREAGYKGLYAIKASGLPGDPVENTKKIIEGVLANM
jgi:hypothetical protein